MNESWMNNPKLKGMDPSKLSMLQSFAQQGSSKSQNDLLPLLMASMSNSKEKGISFSKEEINAILEVMKTGKSRAEIAKMDKMIQMMQLIR